MRDSRLFPLFQPLDALAGIGPKLKPALEHLVQGEHVWDLLLHLPASWLDRRPRSSFAATTIGEIATVQGQVSAVIAPHSSTAPHRIRLVDETGFLTLVFFRANGQWLKGQFPLNAHRIVSGRIEEFKGERQMTHPDYIIDPAKDERPPRIEPIYPLTAGLTNKRVHAAQLAALELLPDDLPEWSPEALIQREGWPSFKDALKGVHNPADYNLEVIETARRRLAYDEALAREIVFAQARVVHSTRRSNALPSAPERQSELLKSLPYAPTGAQKRAFADITQDISNPHPMRRMLQGDVGSGKTLVGAMAAVQASAAGAQTAFMAPTEVLATQQYQTLSQLLEPLGYTVALMIGALSVTARESILLGLADGTIQVCVGTQALFQDAVVFRNLGLVIVDEQHRFGVMDRARLADKAISPHMLVMSATPIPRTLSMAVAGDLDVSILDEKPAGRQPVKTRALPDSRIGEVIAAIGRAVARGERAFWVCPKVDVDDDDSTAVSRHAALAETLPAHVGLVHGRMKASEKEANVEAFRTGRTSVLVATTVIEVGVDVPEATIIVIERAEGFGLAQLHQLRGRVGRGDKPAYCLLLYRPPLTEMAQKRLETLRDTEDGFEIAEADYKLRGPGDILGTRQSGLATFRILDLSSDADLIEIARKDARLSVESNAAGASVRAESIQLLKSLLAPQFQKSQEN